MSDSGEEWEGEESQLPSPQPFRQPPAPVPVPVHEAKVEMPTAPIGTVTSPSQSRRTGAFRIYTPEDPDLTDEIREKIEVAMTAGYYLDKLLHDRHRVEMPEEFSERRVVMRVILQEALVVLAFVLLVWPVVAGLVAGWWLFGFVVAILVTLIVGFYVIKLWQITFVVSTATKTGISRRRVRGLLINEIKPELSTTNIILSQPHRNSIFSSLNIDWWRVRLETAAAEEQPTVKNMRFVRGGDRFVQTIDQYKLALR